MAGRPERELEDDGTPLVSLALGLRELRRSAGSPSYRDMSRQVHRSQTTLSEAAGGRSMPTWETTEAYVRACGGQPEEWRERWAAAARREAADARASEAPHEGASELAEAVAPASSRRRPGSTWLAAAAVAAVVVVVGILLLPGRGNNDGSSSLPTTSNPMKANSAAPISVAVRDGSDPEDNGCARLPGVQLLDTAEINYRGKPAGFVQLKYSPQCGVAWPRFEPSPVTSLPLKTLVHVDIVRPDDQDERFPFEAPFAGVVIFGNVAVSTQKCVYSVVRIDDGASHVEARTHCFRGATYVR